MRIDEPGKAIAVFLGETDHTHGKQTYVALIEKAREFGLAGATATRALMGFGAHSKIHSANLLLLSEDLPVVVYLIDKPERIEAFRPILEDLVKEGTVVSWNVSVEFIRPSDKPVS